MYQVFILCTLNERWFESSFWEQYVIQRSVPGKIWWHKKFRVILYNDLKQYLKKNLKKNPLKSQERVASWKKTSRHQFTTLTSALISFAITECGLLSVVLYASCDSCWLIKGKIEKTP